MSTTSARGGARERLAARLPEAPRLVGVGRDLRRTPTGEHWIEDEDRTHCAGCRLKFNMMRRRHHCRNCGEIFCNNCAPAKMHPNQSSPVRMCKTCSMIGIRTPPAMAGFMRTFSGLFCCAGDD